MSIDRIEWEEAQKACSRMGAHLIVPNSKKEIDYLKSKKEQIWIGANDKINGKNCSTIFVKKISYLFYFKRGSFYDRNK